MKPSIFATLMAAGYVIVIILVVYAIVRAATRLRSTTLDDPRLHSRWERDSPGLPGFTPIRLVFRSFQR
jgi:hypothetical protein